MHLIGAKKWLWLTTECIALGPTHTVVGERCFSQVYNIV